MGGELYRVWRRALDPATVTTHEGLAVVRPWESILDCLAYGTDTALLLQACRTARREEYLSDDELITLEARMRIVAEGRATGITEPTIESAVGARGAADNGFLSPA